MTDWEDLEEDHHYGVIHDKGVCHYCDGIREKQQTQEAERQ